MADDIRVRINDIAISNVLPVSSSWVHDWMGCLVREIVIEFEWSQESEGLISILDKSIKEREGICLNLFKADWKEERVLNVNYFGGPRDAQ